MILSYLARKNCYLYEFFGKNNEFFVKILSLIKNIGFYTAKPAFKNGLKHKRTKPIFATLSFY